jgi:hypothetical protein
MSCQRQRWRQRCGTQTVQAVMWQNVPTTIKCCQLWQACRRLRVVEAERSPAYEEIVRGYHIESVPCSGQVTRYLAVCADDAHMRPNPSVPRFTLVSMTEHSSVPFVRACHAWPPSRSMRSSSHPRTTQEHYVITMAHFTEWSSPRSDSSARTCACSANS